MPLSSASLASALEQRWLAAPGRQMPASAVESADRLAGVVSEWFAAAAAAGMPCATALLRRSQLAASALPALQAKSAQLAGQQLGAALAAYMAGHVFGPGVSSAPAATASLSAELVAVFSDLRPSPSERAERIATACLIAALSTMVVFPPPMTPAPVV